MLIRMLLAVRDSDLRTRLLGALDRPHLHVEPALPDAPEVLTESYDIGVFDELPPRGDVPLVERIRRLPDSPDVVVLRPRDDAEGRARLLADGCLAVLDAELDDSLLVEALDTMIQRRRENRAEAYQARRLRSRSVDPPFVSASPPMLRAVKMARRLAMAESPVLILGETGVGKERFAQILHNDGPRAGGPFVAVNCAALPSELFESELFGHVKGAFTGAVGARRGRIELADQGTLFLDEVGEVPLHLQAKLLRALQERVVQPIGSDTPVEVDVRVVAATNRDLTAEVAAGRFRRDLYYRLSVVELVIPPLRERGDDILQLAESYRRELSEALVRNVTGFTDEALGALTAYEWPGNVRELVNVIERAVLLCSDENIGIDDLPLSVSVATLDSSPEPAPSDLSAPIAVELPSSWPFEPWKVARETLLREGERSYLVSLLEQTQGRIGEAASLAGISARALFEKMRRHGLRKEDFRPAARKSIRTATKAQS